MPWRPWLGGCRLAFVRAELSRQTEDPEAIVEAATDAIERAERIHRRKYAAMSRAILGEGNRCSYPARLAPEMLAKRAFFVATLPECRLSEAHPHNVVGDCRARKVGLVAVPAG